MDLRVVALQTLWNMGNRHRSFSRIAQKRVPEDISLGSDWFGSMIDRQTHLRLEDDSRARELGGRSLYSDPKNIQILAGSGVLSD
jgi:hypothetical protein